MYVHDLEIPALLVELINVGVWPRSTEEANRQNVDPILGKKAASKLSADDDRIVLMAPPFHTIGDEVDSGNDFWNRDLTNVGEIDYRRAVILADFGLGSDSPIILHYGKDIQVPAVMYLKWLGDGADITHKWIQTHDTFEQFATDIGFGQVDD